MNAEQIERRLRRIDAAIGRTERRVESLSAVRDFHDGKVVGAIGGAEVSQHHFAMAARLAFRDPYRALKAWERHEWRLSKLTLAAPSDADVAMGAFGAVSNSVGLMGLTLRGRTILGRDDDERTVAGEALATMGTHRAEWLGHVRRARLHGRALNQVGAQIRGLKNRVGSLRLRREELFNELMALPRDDRPHIAPLWPAASRQPERTAPTLAPPRRAWRAPLTAPEDANDYERVQRRLAALDEAQFRYLTKRDELARDINLPTDEKAQQLAEVDRRLTACGSLKRELTARLTRGRPLLPEDVRLTETELADLREMRRALEAAIDEPLDVQRLPGLTAPQQKTLAALERRTANLDRRMRRYKGLIATLTDPGHDVPASGQPTYRIPDPAVREATVREVERRLALAEARRSDLADAAAAHRILARAGTPEQRRDWRFIADLRAWEREASLSVEERDRRERDRLDRAYRQARSRGNSLGLGR